MMTHMRKAGRKPRGRQSAAPLWLSDRPRIMTALLAVVALALYAVMVPIHIGVYDSEVVVTLIFSAAAVGAPLVSLKYPTVATGIFTTAVLVLSLIVPQTQTEQAPWPWTVPLLIAFAAVVCTVTLAHGWQRGLVLFLLTSTGGVAAAIRFPSHSSSIMLIVATSVVGSVLVGTALMAGRLRLGAELTRQRRVSAEEHQRRLQIEERTRIARDLHDVVAHSMSVIQIQASTARYRLPDLPSIAIAEFEDIAATTRGALTEMRRLLGVLRTEDQQAELAPQQGIEDVPALVDSVRRAGANVSLNLSVGESSAVPASVQIAVFRIVQEALSNAVRHAPGAEIEVLIEMDNDSIFINVHNNLAPPLAPVPTTGYGLRGMRERVALVDGNLEAGTDNKGGWTVTAILPWRQRQVNS